MQQTGLITGASSGIGLALAHEHALRGRDLVILARSEQKLRELAQALESRYEVNVKVIVKDLTEAGACQSVYEELQREGIIIDYLFNNAGFGGHGKFHERELARDLSMIDLNVRALVELTHLFLKDMVARGQGRILNVSSTAGYMPGPLQAVYFATKAFVNSFTWAVANEVADTGVTLTTLNPGPVDTGFATSADLNDTKVFDSAKSAEYTAKRGYSAMEKGKREEITELGLKLAIKGLVPILPKGLQIGIVRSVQEKM